MLLGATWRLWTPLRDLPRVPAFGVLTGVPEELDFPLLALASWGILAVAFRPQKKPMAVAAVMLAALMLLDQLRWQPWAYQALLFALAITALPADSAKRWLRALVVSIYLYAALAKLDATFVATLGQQVIDALTRLLGFRIPPAWTTVRNVLALGLPIGEAAVGLLLAWPKTRRVGVVAAVVLHATLIVALGPLGLDHQPGVLIWNAQAAIYAWLLFSPTSIKPPMASTRPEHNVESE